MQLRGKQERFCQRYVVCFNKAQAARDAGYSEKTAAQIGYNLLRRPEVRGRVDELVAELTEESRVQTHLVLKELSTMLYASVNDYEVDPLTGEVTVKAGVAPEAIRAVREVKKRHFVNGQNRLVTQIDVKLHEKHGPLTNAMRYLGMLNDKLDVTVNQSLADRLKDARERVQRMQRETPWEQDATEPAPSDDAQLNAARERVRKDRERDTLAPNTDDEDSES